MDTVIEVKNLGKIYTTKRSHSEIFRCFDFRLARGEVVAILGPSGCGKSTFLKLVAGIQTPTSGKITALDEKPIQVTKRGHISLMSSESTLLPWKTAFDNVKLSLDLLGIPSEQSTATVRRVFNNLRLDEQHWNSYHFQLSEGQRQRVRLAQAISTNPDVLLIDEPFSNVDEGLRRVLIQYVSDFLTDHRSAVLVTHHAYEACLLADRVMVLGEAPGGLHCEIALPVSRRERQPEYINKKYHEICDKLLSANAEAPV